MTIANVSKLDLSLLETDADVIISRLDFLGWNPNSLNLGKNLNTDVIVTAYWVAVECS